MEEFQELVHFIIIYWSDCSGILIWNRVRGIFKSIFWKVNHNITIINDMMIKSPRDIRNHRTGFRRGGPAFEVSFPRLAGPLSWWLSCFIYMKGVELVHIYYNNWWEEDKATNNVGINLVSNSSTSFENILLPNAEIYNNFLESCCIIGGGIQRTEIMKDLRWIFQGSWGSNNF